MYRAGRQGLSKVSCALLLQAARASKAVDVCVLVLVLGADK